MAKAVAAFTGKSSNGVPEDYAQRVDGVWFTRYMRFNGYGMGMSRWTPVRDDLSSYVRGDVMDYGFNPLRRTDPQGLRLPN